MAGLGDPPRFGPHGKEPPLESPPVVVAENYLWVHAAPDPDAARAIRGLIPGGGRFADPVWANVVAWIRANPHGVPVIQAHPARELEKPKSGPSVVSERPLPSVAVGVASAVKGFGRQIRRDVSVGLKVPPPALELRRVV